MCPLSEAHTMTIRLHQILLPQTLTPFHPSLLPPSSSISFKNPNPNSRNHNLQTLYGSIQFKSLTPLSHLPNSIQTSPSDSGFLFREKILYLENGLNVDSSKALQINPNFRSTPISKLKSVEKCLSSMGIERSAFGRIFDMHPQLLTCDPYVDLYPILDFLLNEVNIPYPDIRKSIVRCPRLLVSSVNNQLRPTLLYLRKLGFVGQQSVTSQTTMLLVSSVEGTLMRKIDYLQTLGFSYSEVVRMVLRSPGLLTFSIENNFCPKVKYFLEEMKGDLSELKRFPQYFSFSLEGKIKPRHRLLVKHGLSVPLSEMLKVSDGEFNTRLIDIQLRRVGGRRLYRRIMHGCFNHLE